MPRTSNDEPGMTPAWMLAWWNVYGGEEGRRLRVLAVHDRGRLVGLAPLVARWVLRGPGVPYRRLETLGTGEPSGDDVCTEYVGPLAERGAERDVAQAFARAVVAGEAGPYDELLLPVMKGDVEMPALLADALRQEGLEVELRETSQCPYVPLPATWEAYLRQLPSSGRYLVNRSLRDFTAWAGGELRLERATTPGRLQEGLRVLAELHEARWKAAGERGAFAGSRFRRFHERVAPRLLDDGALELVWLVAHGRPVAAAYVILHANKATFYQSGRATDVPDAVRPGIVLQAELVRSAIERGLVEYDFLGGASRYKRQLALASRPLVEIRAARRTLREQARSRVGKAVAVARDAREAVRSTLLVEAWE